MQRTGSRVLLAWTLAAMIGSQMSHAMEKLTAGAARMEITPVANLNNWVTQKPYGQVLEPIFARAVVLEHSGRRVAIVSWELLYPMEGAVAKLRKEVARATGMHEADIMVCATHNHSAPWSPILGDPLTKAERKVLNSFLSDPDYPAWADKVFRASVQAVQKADESRKPAALAIARAYVGDVMYNRRPIRPDGTVQGMLSASDPSILPHGLRFGRVDPTLTMLLLRDSEGATIASLYHMACHAVVVYPEYDGINGDWPGRVSTSLQEELGGEALLLQGCCGDINPIRRGLEARDNMAKIIADRAMKASRVAHPLSGGDGLRVSSAIVEAPVAEGIRAELGKNSLKCEVQAITCGDLAIVSFPGEPLTALSVNVLQRSPFPHTIVIGYANGYGVQYVGVPGDKARGGYEMGARGLGTDECGGLLVDAAVRLLEEHRTR